MIYTVTFNPSIDYIIFTDGFEISGLNRAKQRINLQEVRESMYQEYLKL